MLFCRYRISALISLPKFSTNISRFPLKLWSPISKPHRASNSETRQNNLARSMTTIFPHVNPLACSIDDIFLFFFFNPLFAIFAIWQKETKKTTKPMIRWIIRIFPRNARRQSKTAGCRMEKRINRAEARREREREGESFRARALAANWNRRRQRKNRSRRKGKRNVRRDINKVVASSFLFLLVSRVTFSSRVCSFFDRGLQALSQRAPSDTRFHYVSRKSSGGTHRRRVSPTPLFSVFYVLAIQHGSPLSRNEPR